VIFKFSPFPPFDTRRNNRADSAANPRNRSQEGGCPNWPSAHKCSLEQYSACLYFGALGASTISECV
jgi:hypothetical protein